MDYLLENWMGIVRFEKMAHADAHDLLASLFAPHLAFFSFLHCVLPQSKMTAAFCHRRFNNGELGIHFEAKFLLGLPRHMGPHLLRPL
jgi:hypothetical protein